MAPSQSRIEAEAELVLAGAGLNALGLEWLGGKLSQPGGPDTGGPAGELAGHIEQLAEFR